MAYSLAPTAHNLGKLNEWIELAQTGRPQFKVDLDGGTRRLKPHELKHLKVLEAHPSSHQAHLDKIVRGLVRERDRIEYELNKTGLQQMKITST